MAIPQEDRAASPAALAGRLRARLEIDRFFGVDFIRRADPPEPAAPPGPPGVQGKVALLLAAAARASRCTDCDLCEKRNTVVFGEGSPEADLMFVGEAPGEEEDRQGRPFVGKAGQLLTKIIAAMGLSREQVYIANAVKCRPENNRDPLPAEVAACLPRLEEQIELIKPKVLVALGNHALAALAGPGRGITAARGRWLEFRGLRMMPTFHPAFLLRNESSKRHVWEDMKKVMSFLKGEEK